MGVLITADNFEGRFAIPENVSNDLSSYIKDFEEGYLIDLMGADLYAAFKATLTHATPPLPVGGGYLAIYNKFNVDYGTCIVKSKGLVYMLCSFIYFDFMRNIKYKPTSAGIVITTPDTSQNAVNGNLYQYLNEATETYQAIQLYITMIHPELFPPKIAPLTTNFNGEEKSISIPYF